MPYIPKANRSKYDALIDSLAKVLNDTGDNDAISGEMNYVLFRLAKIMCDDTSGGRCRYARMAVVCSSMREAEAEFRRRIMAPYEDQKIDALGDVELRIQNEGEGSA